MKQLWPAGDFVTICGRVGAIFCSNYGVDEYMDLKYFKVLVVACLILLISISGTGRAQQEDADTTIPGLAVIIVVDQMRPDHLTRFDHLYTGGFRRLLDSGFTFINAFHNHAITEAGSGYAAISTGAYPSRNGIIGDSWFDAKQRRRVYCVEDSTTAIAGQSSERGCSPIMMKTMTLGDWVWRDSPDSKIFSIAIKDAAAVTMAGFRGDYALWYDEDDGTFVTSLYYDAIYPEWLRKLNELGPTEQYFAGVWEKLLPDSAYEASRADDFSAESDGMATTFPHNFLPAEGEDPDEYFEKILTTPYADHMVIELAKACITNEALGSDDDPDILWIGCSAADYIGHTYGPYSQEVQDYYLRLDRYLEGLFVHLDTLRGEDSYVVALASSHGVLPLPEHLQEQGITAGRLDPDSIRTEIDSIGRLVGREMGLAESPILAFDKGVYLDDDVIMAERADRRRVELSLAEQLKELPYIEDVFTTRDLTGNVFHRQYLQQFQNNYYEGRSPDIMIRFRENFAVQDRKRGTAHGSCYESDSDVPVIFYGARVPHGESSDRVETASIAPTIGQLIYFSAYHELDGESLVPFFNWK